MTPQDRMLVAIFGTSASIYLGLSVAMAIVPGILLSQTPPGPGVAPLTRTQSKGRAVYVAEGCAYCHTQQVRPLATDTVFGRAAAPGDFAYQTPELLGSERTGPDLSNIGVRQPSTVWQFLHLYEPRAVVKQSIMPAFPWLFRTVDKAPDGVAPVPIPAPFAPWQGRPGRRALLRRPQPRLQPQSRAVLMRRPAPRCLPPIARRATATRAPACQAPFPPWWATRW
jgi:cytochrome c oxidase cbb3-type subunit 2